MNANFFSFFDIISRNASCFGEKPAWMDASQPEAYISFSDIKREVDSLSCGLQHIGVSKGDRIGVLAQNHLNYFILYGAAAALGAILLPINWRLSEDEITYILQDGKPTVIFSDSKYLDILTSIHTKLSFNARWICFTKSENIFQSINTLRSSGHIFTPEPIYGDDEFIIIHTAAVTGKPRGAVLSHMNLFWANLQIMALMNITKKDIHLSLLPYFHVAGLFMAMACFHAGAMNINMAKFDPDKAVELIKNYSVSVMFDFAPILNSILESQKRSGQSIKSLRVLTGLESPETIEKYQKLTGGTFYSMYGQTETSCITTLSPYNECPGSAGQPIPMAKVGILDDHDQEVSVGEVGEIGLRGPMVFKGYWSLPDNTTQTFKNGWHHTGDLGHIDEQGYLWYEGRREEKELIKPGGENVYPAEVEDTILLHPSVKQVVVFGVPDSKWKEAIKAVCTLKPGKELAARELVEFVGQRIARYKKPQYVEFVSELPKDRNGNIDRSATKKQFGFSQI